MIRSGCVTKSVQPRDKVSRHHGSYKSNPVQISVAARIRLVVTRNNCRQDSYGPGSGKGGGGLPRGYNARDEAPEVISLGSCKVPWNKVLPVPPQGNQYTSRATLASVSPRWFNPFLLDPFVELVGRKASPPARFIRRQRAIGDKPSFGSAAARLSPRRLQHGRINYRGISITAPVRAAAVAVVTRPMKMLIRDDKNATTIGGESVNSGRRLWNRILARHAWQILMNRAIYWEVIKWFDRNEIEMDMRFKNKFSEYILYIFRGKRAFFSY